MSPEKRAEQIAKYKAKKQAKIDKQRKEFLEKGWKALKEKKIVGLRAASKKRHEDAMRRKKNKYYRKRYAHLKSIEKEKKYKRDMKRFKAKEKYEERIANGDVWGRYKVIITCNGKNRKTLKVSRWLLEAYSVYNENLEENKKVICPKRITERTNEGKKKYKSKYRPTNYEILLLEEVDPTVDDGKRYFRDFSGKLIENSVLETKNGVQYAIRAKNNWYIEETFSVYGYDNVHDRKTLGWVIDNLILPELSKDNPKRILRYVNYVIIQTMDDIEIVQCKQQREAIYTYGILLRELKKQKHVYFLGTSKPENSRNMIAKIQAKTGWSHKRIVSPY